jgi:hypothetical protein
LALAISILALLATFYQLYLQRIHDEKSLKPLVQIDVKDDGQLIYVRVQNNGLGPFIIEKLSFIKDEQVYNSVRKCISLEPQFYHNIAITETVKKVILPNSYLDVFSVRFCKQDTTEYLAQVRQELSLINLKVEGRDIYDNNIVAERNLDWFIKYTDI